MRRGTRAMRGRPQLGSPAVPVIVVIAGAVITAIVGQRSAILTDAIVLGAILLWGFTALTTAMSHDGPVRRTWTYLTASSVLWIIASISWELTDTSIATPGLTGPSIVYLIGAVPLLLSLRGLALPEWEPGAPSRVALDLVSVVLAAILLSLVTVWRPIIDGAADNWSMMSMLIYPIFTTFIITINSVVMLRTDGPVRLDLLYTSLAFILLATASTQHALAVLGGTVETRAWWLGALFVGAFLLLMFAAIAARRHTATMGKVLRDSGDSYSALLPDILLFATLLAVVFRGIESRNDVAMGVALFAATMLRQTLLRVDSHRLRRELESRVSRRTGELESLAEQHRRVVASVGEGIVGVDANGVVQVVNPAASHLLRRMPEELLGTWICASVCVDHDDDCALALALRSPILDDLVPMRFGFKRNDGTTLLAEATIAPMTMLSGESGAVITFRDITERELVDRMKREFVSAVSHELRTPLTAIRGSLEMLVDGEAGELPPAAHELARVASRGSERLGRLVNDIIDVERLETGRLRVELSAHPVRPVIVNALRLMQPVADTRGVNLRIEELEGVVVCDPDRINQVVVNLLDNALKFTPAGRQVTVRATATRAGRVLIEIHDEGRGIPQDQLDLVFRPFHQVATSDADKLGGTGLGLAISRAIIEQHEGDVWVESIVGEGSIFCFTLPAAEEAGVDLPHDATPTAADPDHPDHSDQSGTPTPMTPAATPPRRHTGNGAVASRAAGVRLAARSDDTGVPGGHRLGSGPLPGHLNGTSVRPASL